MIPALHQYPRFEKGSPSTEYQQIVNFCVNYLEGVLVGFIHMEIPAELESQSKDLIPLQKKLLSRERTVRHAFQFQVEKHFSDFKLISRTRLRVKYATTGLTDNKSSRILDIIETIGDKHQDKHKNQLQNTARRFKTLVHRSDGNHEDNPISPYNLCRAFLASIETLNFSMLKNRKLFQLFDHTLNDQLGNFYNQIDLGLYYLDILTELTDAALFSPPESEDITDITRKFEPDLAKIHKIEEDQVDEEATDDSSDIEPPAEIKADELIEEETSETEENIVAEEKVEEVETNELVIADEEVEIGNTVKDNQVDDYIEADKTVQTDRESKTAKVAEKEVTYEAEEKNKAEETENALENIDNAASIEEEKAEEANPEQEQDAVTSLLYHEDKIHRNQLEIENFIYQFKISTENGTLDFVNLFSQLNENISPLVEKKQRNDIQKFTHFFTSLLNNTLLSTPLKTQLSRLSAPLLDLVLIDPFFFRSSSHPVNDFLQSIIDFELRFNHHGESLSTLSQSIDALLQISNPTLNDYQPLIDGYENFKEIEIIRLERLKEESTLREEELKAEILQLINEMTEELVVDHDTMQFFYDDWQFLLLHLAHYSGKESAEFKNSVNIAKMLSWFLDQNKTGAHPRFESTTFKSLLTSIEIGLVALNFSSEHRHRVRKQLVNEYKQTNERPSFTMIPSTSKPQLKQQSNPAINMDDASSLSSPDDALQFAQNLTMGDWVEIKLPSNNSFTRAKLKWKAADYSLFIFIDQRGHKIKECDLDELQQDFSNGKIKILIKSTRLGSAYY